MLLVSARQSGRVNWCLRHLQPSLHFTIQLLRVTYVDSITPAVVSHLPLNFHHSQHSTRRHQPWSEHVAVSTRFPESLYTSSRLRLTPMYHIDMDDFELFRARSLHGGVLGLEQSPVNHVERRRFLDRHQVPTSKCTATGGPTVYVNNLNTGDNGSDGHTGASKFRTKNDDAMAIPEVVRCSNAWVDFSATELLPVADMDPGEEWRRPRKAWMSCSKPSVVGVAVPDQSAIHEFDVYRLRSFATAAGRIVNRGDYFRVRQRIHPTVESELERLRGPLKAVSEHPVRVAAAPTSNSSASDLPSNIEYRPVVYYATNNGGDVGPGDVETGVEDNEEEDSSDERTRLLANCRRTKYFSRSRSGGESKAIRRRRLISRGGGGDSTPSESASTNVPDNDAERSRVTSVIRVVVLGDRNVGKTTLARQLLTSEHLANYHAACFNFPQGRLYRRHSLLTKHTCIRPIK